MTDVALREVGDRLAVLLESLLAICQAERVDVGDGLDGEIDDTLHAWWRMTRQEQIHDAR